MCCRPTPASGLSLNTRPLLALRARRQIPSGTSGQDSHSPPSHVTASSAQSVSCAQRRGGPSTPRKRTLDLQWDAGRLWLGLLSTRTGHLASP